MRRRRGQARGRVITAIFLVLLTGLSALAGVLAWRTVPAAVDQAADKRVQAPATSAYELDHEVAAERLGAAIRHQTISRGGGSAGGGAPVEAQAFHDLHDFLVTTFPAAHQQLDREAVNEFSLLYRWQGTDQKLTPRLVMGHMDVVPVEHGSEAEWRYLPFSGLIAEGFIWGRGAIDDKVTVMGLLEAVEYLVSAGFTPQRTMYFAFGHDEEIGGRNGAAAIASLLAERGAKLDFVVDEGGSIRTGLFEQVSRPVARVGVAEKGFLSLELVAHGVGGHSSRPSRNNSVGMLARAIDKLERNIFPSRLQDPIPQLLTALAPQLPWTERMMLGNLWLFGPVVENYLSNNPATDAMIRTTTAPTMLNAGFKENVLPRDARAVVNFRLLPGDRIEDVIAQVTTIIDNPDVTVARYGKSGGNPSALSSVTGQGYQTLAKSIGQIFPEAVIVPNLVLGATDSKHFAGLTDNIYRFLPIVLGPSDTGRAHGLNERLAVADYGRAIRFYISLLENAGGS